MKRFTRLALVIIMTACIYGISLYILPRLGISRSLRELYSWIGSGDITQFAFLIISLVLMRIFGKGNWSMFGFKGVRIRQLTRPVIVTAIIEGALFILGMVVMSILGGPPQEADGPDIMSGMLKMIISVWVIASTIEEIFYRGLVQSLLDPLKAYGFNLFSVRISLPVAVAGLMFGLGHLCLMRMFQGVFLVQIIVSCTALGFIAGYFREKTGSLVPAIVAHMTANIVGWLIPTILMQLAPA